MAFIHRIIRSFAFWAVTISIVSLATALFAWTGSVVIEPDSAAVYATFPAGHWCGYQWRGDPTADLGAGDHFAIRVGNAFCDVV